MRTKDVLSFLAFGVIIASVLGYFATLGLRVSPPTDRTNLVMKVSDINGLVNGSSVLLRGAPVGKVTAINTTLQAATIDFYIDSRYRIPANSEVRLENLSALGETYIGFIPQGDTGPMLQNGQTIATQAIKQAPSISDLSDSVVRVLNQLEPGALERIVNEVDVALPDPAAVLPNISRASVDLKNTVAGMQGSGRILLSNFETLLRNAEWVQPVLTELAPTLREAGEGYQDFVRHIPVLVHRNAATNVANLNKLIARLQAFLDDRAPDLRVLGDAFQPKLNDIAGALMNFDTGQILSNMLAAVPADGTITLHVVP
jgi:phospholipid/cholesterol/gamma-HCH transport system substrate-binding protein